MRRTIRRILQNLQSKISHAFCSLAGEHLSSHRAQHIH
jgi:hypothetical protein